MKIQPSNAMEKGFTAQLMKSVTPMPRQCSLTCDKAAKSIFTSIGMIISQISDRHRQVDLGDLDRADAVEYARNEMPERDTDNDAKGDPNGEIAFECGHCQTRGPGPCGCAIEKAIGRLRGIQRQAGRRRNRRAFILPPCGSVARVFGLADRVEPLLQCQLDRAS